MENILPVGMHTPVLGYLAFVAIKFAGYAFAATYFNATYAKKISPWAFGAVRTLVGMAVGGALYLVMEYTKAEFQTLYVVLVPIRLVEWFAVVALFYDRGLADRTRLLKCAAAGVVLSVILDMPAGVLGFLSAGVWVS